MLAVVLHNGLGLALGYGGARLMRLDPRRARTLAIEVGMQNSGLGVALAVKHFSAGAALPGALFSVWHNIYSTTSSIDLHRHRGVRRMQLAVCPWHKNQQPHNSHVGVSDAKAESARAERHAMFQFGVGVP